MQPCPQCGAQIHFKSRFSTMTICTYCQSMLVRHQDTFQYEGKMAVLSQDMTVLQVGTKGKYNNKAFEIIGQLKVNWENGFWNEWYVLEENGATAWIAEALGSYSYVYEILLPTTLDIPRKTGKEIYLNDKLFITCDIKSYEVEGIVGELPFEIQSGIKGVSIDCQNEQNNCAYIDCIEESSRAFVGSYVEFETLNLTDLREIEGW